MSDEKMIVGVMGAGAMGSGIAQLAATAGHRVVVGDISIDAVRASRNAMKKSLQRDVEKGRLDADSVDVICNRVTEVGDIRGALAAYAECGVIIEAVAEQLVVKRDLLTRLEGVVPDSCILATNTSSLSVSAIGGGLRLPQRVVGMHFFNPATILPLVEIVPGIRTSSHVVDAAKVMAESWKKITVIASDTPGFIVNRIARPFYGEALRQLEEGIADIATIDWAMREVGGFRMGPFELMDFIGNDINYAVTSSVFEGFFFDPRYRPAMTQRRLVEAGLYGRKRARGYYDYADDAVKPEPTRDRELGEKISDRIVAMLINEAADALQMRVASASDIELAMLKGVNYPKGLLAWGDEIGVEKILAKIEWLQAEYGEDRYRPSPLLRRAVKDGLPLMPTAA